MCITHNKKRRGHRNPLKLDPSRTTLLRRQFEGDLSRRLTSIRRDMVEYITKQMPLTVNYDWPSADKKLKGFNRWLKKMFDDRLLMASPTTGEPLGAKPWTYKYIDSAYKKGVMRAYVDAKGPELQQPQPYYAGTKAQFLQSSFARPERLSKLAMLYTRSYDQLKGITGPMASTMSRTLADGMAHGYHPTQIARSLAKLITGMGIKRAKVIARTEIMHAHSEGQLDAFEDLGIDELGAEVEFSTAGDDGVCDKCDDLDGGVYSVEEARGVIPVHPQCLLPDTEVSARGVVGAFTMWYDGPAVELVMTEGRSLAVTANHKLLTPAGFVRAHCIRNGDHVVDGSLLQRKLGGHPDDHDGPTLIQDVVAALAKSSDVSSVCMPASPKYFHGDARFCDGNIHVVKTNRLLSHNRESLGSESVNELPLCASWGFDSFDGLCDFDAVLVGLSLAAHGVVSGEHLLRSRFGRHLGPLQLLSFLSPTYRNAQIIQSSTDNISAHLKLPSQFGLGCSRGICLADSVVVQAEPQEASRRIALMTVRAYRHFHYSGMVYDLQTVSGLYIGNGLLSSNCRCCWVPAIKKSLKKLRV